MMRKKVLAFLGTTILTAALCFAFTGCGAETVGLYSQYSLHNHTDMADPVSYSYTLEVYKDGTYRMNYETMWAIPVVTLVYGRNITAFGKYEVKESNEEEGTITYTLAMPTRLTMVCQERSSVSVSVDTDNWPAADEENDMPGGITYTLNARATTEVWEDKDEFIKAYGREYEVLCDTVKGSMRVTVTSHGGKQIPGDAAVVAESA